MISGTRVNDQNPDVDIVSLSGRLGVGTDQDLASELSDALEQSSAGVLLDMAEVTFVSSSGLRALMLAYKRAGTTGKRMAMMLVKPGVYKILKLTALVQPFHVVDDEAQAMEWFLANDA